MNINQNGGNSILSLCLRVGLAFLVSINPVLAERTTTYFHSDAQGSVVAASDEDGNLLWRKSYSPYGQQIDIEDDNEALSYTGKPHDESTGLTYFGARYYDPQVGRFMGIDPASVRGHVGSNPMMFNRYAYANNNPYRYVDPDGRISSAAVYGVGGVLVVGTIAYGTCGGSGNPWCNAVRGLGDRFIGSVNDLFNESADGGNSETVTNSVGEEVERKFVDDQEGLLGAAEEAAGGSLDDYNNYKPDWWESPDGGRRIEWNPNGHANTNEGPHVTVRDFDGKRHSVTEKIFIKGREKYSE